MPKQGRPPPVPANPAGVPTIQLEPIVTAAGQILRGARLEQTQTGTGPVRIQRRNVIAALAQAGQRRTQAGQTPMIRAEHVAIAHILITDHDEVGGGPPIAISNPFSSSRSAQPNPEGRLMAIAGHINRRDRYFEALDWLGSHRPLVEGVVLRGINVHVWGASTGMDRKQLVGYLAAALDRLGEFYQARGFLRIIKGGSATDPPNGQTP